MGLIAGPLSPPITLPSIGRRRRQSIAMPRQVLMSEMASAPPAAAAFAIVGTLVTFGVSLAMIGVAVAARHSATSRSHIAGSVPKSTPPETFGQEMLSSIAATPDRLF